MPQEHRNETLRRLTYYSQPGPQPLNILPGLQFILPDAANYPTLNMLRQGVDDGRDFNGQYEPVYHLSGTVAYKRHDLAARSLALCKPSVTHHAQAPRLSPP